MAALKCKMCGGELILEPDSTVAECDSCGSRQTVPQADDEKKLGLFARANRLRFACEFDKAFGVYESIVSEFPEDAEGYWGLVLCQYGIEYVDDPGTGKKIPTSHRSSFDSIFDDPNFEMVMEYADPVARSVYREEARAIETIREGILEVSAKEAPYDIFICYKETDAQGNRTIDSVLAQDVYDALTEKGYRVFFSRISLEDKLGKAYEPYIFAALNSAKVMLAFGTDYEYFNAVWVKNEWSRYLNLIAKGEKKTLIPCFKDIEAYDMPKEFRRFQAQDMGKVGATQDLLRGIGKILGEVQPAPAPTAPAVSGNPQSQALLKRAMLFLEEENWAKVAEYCEQVLDADPENSMAYWIQELGQRNCQNADALAEYYYEYSCEESRSLGYARRFANEETKALLSYFDNKQKEMVTNHLEFLRKKKEAEQREIEQRKEAARLREEKLQERQRARQLARANDPEAQELRARIQRFRENAEELRGRVFATNNQTLGVDIEGNVLATKMLNDKYKIYGAVTEEAVSWTDIAEFHYRYLYCVGLKTDGTLIVNREKGQYSEYAPTETLLSWKNIASLYCGPIGWYGLKRDGTVVFAPNPKAKAEYQHGQDEVSGLTNIQKILGEYDNRLICLREDRTLAATPLKAGEPEGHWPEMAQWTDIVGLKKIPGRYVGIRKDGTLVATSYVNNGEKFAQGHGDDRWDEIRTWTDIVQFERLGQRIVGLDAYGDLYATSKFIPDEPEDGVVDIWEKIHSWHGLVFLNSWLNYVVGLTVDGTVVSAKWFKEAGKEKEDYGQADLNGWKNVAYLVLSWKKTLGVRQDGTLMIAGDFDKEHGADQVGHIRLFRDFNTLAQNRAKKAQEASYKAYLEDVDRKRKEAYESRKLAAAEVYLQEKKRLQAEAEKEIDNNLQHKADLSSRCNALEIRRAGLGLFKGKEKAALSEQISQLDQQIRLIPTEDAVRSKYRPKIAEQETLAKQTLDSLKKTIENEFPKMSMEEFMQQ